MPDVPHPSRPPSHDPDVCPATPHGPGKEWTPMHELMVGLGDIHDITPADDTVYLEYEKIVHLHPGPLGFA